jgi:hypothetical protein
MMRASNGFFWKVADFGEGGPFASGVTKRADTAREHFFNAKRRGPAVRGSLFAKIFSHQNLYALSETADFGWTLGRNVEALDHFNKTCDTGNRRDNTWQPILSVTSRFSAAAS